MSSPPPLTNPPKQGLGTGAKVAIGCGVATLVVIVACGIAGFAGWRWVEKQIAQFEQEFAELGLDPGGTGQMLTVTQAPTEPSYYKGQIVTLNFNEPVDVPIGVIAQQVEVSGEFKQPVYFRAQVIVLKSNSRFHQDVDVMCQVIDDQGATIDGKITGTYQKQP